MSTPSSASRVFAWHSRLQSWFWGPGRTYGDDAGSQAGETHPGGWSRAAAVSLAIAIVLSIAFLIVFSHRPMAILGPVSPHDDGLYIRLGTSLANGDWLGAYDQYTLGKGPGYPFFLAANYWLGLPISVAHALFHCAAAGLFAWTVAKLSRSHWLGLIVFLVLLWHPLFLTQRAVREGIYTGQILIICALASNSLLLAGTRRNSVFAAAAAGLFLAWCWLTREEGVLLVPGLAILVIAALLMARRKPARLLTLLAATAAATVTFLAVHLAFNLKNHTYYGSFVGVEFREKNFVAALDALQSVKAEKDIIFVPVSRSARQRIYAVSPTFATLKSYFDPPGGSSPWQFGCDLWKWTCGEIGSGWFVWALRDAASRIGHYRSPAAASQFFEAIAREVNGACEKGALTCERAWISYMPRVTSEQLSWIPKDLAEAIRLVSAPHLDWSGSTSMGEREPFARTLAFLNHPVHLPSDYPKRHVFTGWYFDGTSDWFSVAVLTPDGNAVPAVVERGGSADLVAHFNSPTAANQRFRMETLCRADCRLVFQLAGNERMEARIGELLQNASRGTRGYRAGKATLWFDNASNTEDTAGADDPRMELVRKLRPVLASTYAALTPILLVLGLMAFLGSLFIAFRRRASERSLSIMAVAASAWVLVITRIAALVLIAISSFPAINVLYLSSTIYLAPAAALLSLWALVSAMRDGRDRSQHPLHEP